MAVFRHFFPHLMFDWDSHKDNLDVEAIVERCTSDMLFQPDYEQNMAIVDRLNDKPKLIDTFLNSIKRRMTNPSEEIVLTLCVNKDLQRNYIHQIRDTVKAKSALECVFVDRLCVAPHLAKFVPISLILSTAILCFAYQSKLIEMILKNVPGALEVWGKREYQESVVSVVVNTKHLRAREALLELIQSLGIAYQNETTLKYAAAYKELLTRHKVSFPPVSKQAFVAPKSKPKGAPTATTGGHVHDPDLHRSGHRTGDIDPFDPAELYGVDTEGTYEQVRMRTPKTSSKSKTKHVSIEEQLDQVSSSLGLLNDILDGLGPGDKVADNELIQTVLPTIERVHETIIRILQHDSGKLDETLNVRLFSANDAISEAMSKYERAKKDQLPNQTGARRAPVAVAKVPSAPPKPTTTATGGKKDDEFDEFAQLAQRKRPGQQVAADLFSLNLSPAPTSTVKAQTMGGAPTNVPAASNPFLTPSAAPLFPSAASGTAPAANLFLSPDFSMSAFEPLQPLQPTSPSKPLTPNIIQPQQPTQQPPSHSQQPFDSLI